MVHLDALQNVSTAKRVACSDVLVSTGALQHSQPCAGFRQLHATTMVATGEVIQTAATMHAAA
jgi:hypothetical protein